MSSTKNPIHRVFKIDVAHHGDLSDTKFDPRDNLQVIGMGLSRTGTTSLQVALTRLGFGPSHGGVDAFRSAARTESFIQLYERVLQGVWKPGDAALTARLHELMRGYKSTTDIPIYPLVDEVYAAYPNAKYILTTRPTGAQGWWKSLWDASGWHFRRDVWRRVYRALISSVYWLRRTDDKVQLYAGVWTQRYGGPPGPHIYDKHNAYVRKVIPESQLLVYDVREGWAPLCKFLDVPIPSEPFPNLNETAAMKSIYIGMMCYGACAWMIYLGGAAAAGYLALNPQVAVDLYRRAVNWVSQIATTGVLR